MKNLTRPVPDSMRRQHGAVAIIVGLSLFILVGMLALVLDLGHLYVAKTELQNAADAAALSGAKELDGTVAGITRAQNQAIQTAGLNKYDLNATAVTINAANLMVGSCPDDGCMVAISSVTSSTLAADKTFLKVDTGQRSLDAWFAPIWNTLQTQTYGMAVAGKYTVDVAPIAVCKLEDPGTTNELGYERGVTYKVSDSNPLGPGTMYWLDPESNIPGNCPVTSTNDTLPYVCTGRVSYTPIVGQTVNTNTGISDPQLEAVDSRFGVFNSKNKCDPSTAPADTNVKEYIYDSATAGSPRDWMGTDPTQQSIRFITDAAGKYRPVPYGTPRAPTDYGVLWSAFRPTGATTAQWSSLYSGQSATSYPEPSPYAQTSGNFFTAPTSASKSGRRVMNMTILECTAAGGVCRTATVLGVGKFFLQKKANTPSDKEIYVEFGGLLPNPLPTGEIRLYR
ncbi:Putative Flp pilus-assembly TadE/G-like [Formivibrio citricus]|uniref:Flp pilus-assembly TadE/G-like n=2 Tax=Formivibrio citricus TaxID=83765 RepID=A0A1I4X0B1_9NEIS|nr:Putative Flp pilus-assembly TadE/G-like [Formivibrio citricus]